MRARATNLEVMEAGLDGIDQKAQAEQWENLTMTPEDYDLDKAVSFVKTEQGWSYKDNKDVIRVFQTLQKAIEDYIRLSFVVFLVKYTEESDLKQNIAKVIDLSRRCLDKEISIQVFLDNRELFNKTKEGIAQMLQDLEENPPDQLFINELSIWWETYPCLPFALDYISSQAVFAEDLIAAVAYLNEDRCSNRLITGLHYKSICLHSALQCIEDVVTDMEKNPTEQMTNALKTMNE